MIPQIDKEKCNGCGLCISICMRKSLALVDGIVVILEGIECDWCTQCEVVCATGAINCPFEIILES